MKFMNNHYGQSQIFGRARCKMPMNIQFFAEPSGGDGGGTGDGVDGNDNPGGAGTISADEHQAQIERLETEKLKLKSDLDKALKKLGDVTKQNRSGMTETQLEIQALKDQIEEMANQNKELMESNKNFAEESRISRYTKSFMSCSMDDKTAEILAQAAGELKDEPKFISTLKKFVENLAKSAGEDAIQELIKKNPEIKSGTGDSDKNALAKEKAKEAANRRSGADMDILKHYIPGGMN